MRKHKTIRNTVKKDHSKNTQYATLSTFDRVARAMGSITEKVASHYLKKEGFTCEKFVLFEAKLGTSLEIPSSAQKGLEF